MYEETLGIGRLVLSTQVKKLLTELLNKPERKEKQKGNIDSWRFQILMSKIRKRGLFILTVFLKGCHRHRTLSYSWILNPDDDHHAICRHAHLIPLLYYKSSSESDHIVVFKSATLFWCFYPESYVARWWCDSFRVRYTNLLLWTFCLLKIFWGSSYWKTII